MEKQKKCLIIYNPISGKGISKDILDKYQEILSSRGYLVDLVATLYSNHATQTVSEAGNYDVVFSIGGDGTLNEVVKGNYQREDKLTICPLPSGTCNDVATMLGYGKNPINNLEMALDGEVNEIDIGTINDNPFIYVVGMGKFMNIPYETSSESKRKNGYMAYIKESAGELFSSLKGYQAEILIDGVKLDGKYSLAMVSNSNHIAGINNFHKDVYLDDGMMEVLLCTAKNKREFIISFLKHFMGLENNNIIVLKAHDISIKLFESLDKDWCIDGEKFESNINEYNIKIQGKMPILSPQIRARKLFNKNNGKN